MALSDCFVSVVAPLSNDGSIAKPFIADVMGVLQSHYTNYELVLVDDGSTDDTVGAVSELLTQYPCIRLIRLSRQFGTEIAFSAGLDTAIGDFIITMTPNSDPPLMIPDLVEDCRR